MLLCPASEAVDMLPIPIIHQSVGYTPGLVLALHQLVHLQAGAEDLVGQFLCLLLVGVAIAQDIEYLVWVLLVRVQELQQVLLPTARTARPFIENIAHLEHLQVVPIILPHHSVPQGANLPLLPVDVAHEVGLARHPHSEVLGQGDYDIVQGQGARQVAQVAVVRTLLA